ncbi:MAG: hypothetical protein ACRYF3_06330 [Janthinobacterium lividum]
MRWPPWRRDDEAASRRHEVASWTSGLPTGVTELIDRLPAPEALRQRCRALAMLEAILTGEWEERFFHFDAHWAVGEQLASMRDGAGDEWSITFARPGVWVRGFAHESPMSPWKQSPDRDWLADVPERLRAAAAQPAFTGRDLHGQDLALVTVACWWQDGPGGNGGWHPVQLRTLFPSGVDDGAEDLFTELDGEPDTYLAHARRQHDVELRRRDVEHVQALHPLTEELVQRMAPGRTLADLVDDLELIDYPGGG